MEPGKTRPALRSEADGREERAVLARATRTHRGTAADEAVGHVAGHGTRASVQAGHLGTHVDERFAVTTSRRKTEGRSERRKESPRGIDQHADRRPGARWPGGQGAGGPEAGRGDRAGGESVAGSRSLRPGPGPRRRRDKTHPALLPADAQGGVDAEHDSWHRTRKTAPLLLKALRCPSREKDLETVLNVVSLVGEATSGRRVSM